MRISRLFGLGVTFLSVVACHSSNDMPMEPLPISQSFDVRLQDIFGGVASGLTNPIDLQAPPGDPRLFIAELGGRIRVAQGGALLATPFLDISGRIYTQGEAGLLSFAFDPQFAGTRPFVYVHFIEEVPGTQGDILIERYEVSADPNVLQTPGTEVIRIPHHDFSNHYGGHVFFGPDGMLYLSTGDGGNGGDSPLMNGQNAATHLGKILRIDVSSLPYTIPSDNPMWPMVGQNENWAIGLRNPFRYAFDGAQLYIADVGQGEREEVDVVSASAAGLNYGWNIMEGTRCFAGPCPPPLGVTLTPPVYDYDHSQGGCAIIGGYVYRGSAMPGLRGTYFFSDLCLGFVRGLTIQNGITTVVQAPTANVGANPLSFGQDGAGEIYILANDGRVLKIVKP